MFLHAFGRRLAFGLTAAAFLTACAPAPALARTARPAAAAATERLEITTAKGPVRLSEVEGAQKEILAIARRLAEAGELVLGGKGAEEYV